MQLRIFHRNFSRTAPGLVRTCEIFENWGNPWQSLAVILSRTWNPELFWQGLKSTGVSVRELKAPRIRSPKRPNQKLQKIC